MARRLALPGLGLNHDQRPGINPFRRPKAQENRSEVATSQTNARMTRASKMAKARMPASRVRRGIAGVSGVAGQRQQEEDETAKGRARQERAQPGRDLRH